MGLTSLLKKSIAYEQSKTDVYNLLTHKADDLSVLLIVIDQEQEAIKHAIDSNQYYLDSAEDMEEGLETKLRATIALHRAKLESLLAWRTIVRCAYQKVSK